MALTIYLALIVLIAYMEAQSDAAAIQSGQRINHADELVERAVSCFAAGFICCAMFSAWRMETLLWIPAAWGTFTPSFRWMLNRARGLDWRYVSPSNWYDRQFLRRADSIDQAGKNAYAFEAGVLVASLLIYAWTA